MQQWWEQLRQHRLVAHALRALDRFNVRGGGQFAAAISYFSVLSLVPILMLAFSGLGLALTVFYPGSLGFLEGWLGDNLQAYGDLGQTLRTVVAGALSNWAAIGLAGLAIALWSGATWIGNLKRASQALMRHDYDNPPKALSLPLDLLVNFGALLVLFVGVVLTWAATLAATSLVAEVGSWVGLADGIGAGILVGGVSMVASVAAGTLLFWWMFHWFALTPIRPKLLWIGALVGAAGLVLLQAMAGYLIAMFSKNLSASLFGPVIVLMLFMNLFATLILYVAAWLATADVSVPELTEPEVAERSESAEATPGQSVVSSEVAQRSMGVGLVAGYTVGAATGLGLGALIASTVARIGRRKGD
jgi:membrane protein